MLAVKMGKCNGIHILSHNYRDVLLRLSVKNGQGRTFDDISSLKFDFKVSDESLLRQSSPDFTVSRVAIGDGVEFGQVSHPGRAFQSFTPLSRDGEVDLVATLVGYDEKVLNDRRASTPPPLPRVPDDDDEDEEDADEFLLHGHHLRAEVELQMADDATINKARREQHNRV